MSKSLVIVESPAKAKTINKYLGNNYVVKSSVGHIRDLPTVGSASGEKAKPISTKGLSAEEKQALKQKKEQDALVKRMGVDPYHSWKANYQILPGKEKVVAELKSLAKNADHIYLATDLVKYGSCERPTNPSFFRSRCRVHGVAITLEKSGERVICRARSVCCGKINCGT